MSSPQEKIERLVADYGSDDKLAAAVNVQLGTRLTRQMVIRWRTGQIGVGKKWAARLAEFAGGSPDDYRGTPLTWQEQVERRLERIERLLDERLPPAG